MCAFKIVLSLALCAVVACQNQGANQFQQQGQQQNFDQQQQYQPPPQQPQQQQQQASFQPQPPQSFQPQQTQQFQPPQFNSFPQFQQQQQPFQQQEQPNFGGESDEKQDDNSVATATRSVFESPRRPVPRSELPEPTPKQLLPLLPVFRLQLLLLRGWILQPEAPRSRRQEIQRRRP
ncbi:uncharacterized protein [Bemisia tabaci]|uniref:uncharacterized protein n=1 Tax=Bemisia tabaci TaxID=7038 RepID=UPI003B28B343